MADKNLDVLAINETRLSDSIDNSCIHIQGYDIVRRDRNRNGGGIVPILYLFYMYFLSYFFPIFFVFFLYFQDYFKVIFLPILNLLF